MSYMFYVPTRVLFGAGQLNNLHKQAVFSSVQSKKLSPNTRREFFFPIVYFHIRASRSPAFVLLLIDTGTAPPAAV